MTDFATDETSREGSTPAELYEFIGPATTYRYASGIETVTLGGHDYAPLAGLVRTAISLGTTRDTPTLTVTMPVTAAVVAAYAYGEPPRSLELRVYRYQPTSDDYVIDWRGDVTSIKPRGEVAEVSIPSLLAARLGTVVPGLVIRKHCLHVLGDARCRVVMTLFDVATTVSAASGTAVTVASVGGEDDQWFRGGEIVRDSDGERRLIVDQVGGVLELVSPFGTLNGGDAVTLYAGCDHSVATCAAKFNNVVNFSGCATIPKFNPFRVPVRLGST